MYKHLIMRNLFCVLIYSLVFTNVQYGQFSFQNSSDLLGKQDVSSGYVMGVSDLNGDGLDDIIRFDGAQQCLVDYQNADGTFTNVNLGNLTNSDVWSVVVADVDENGINDLVTGAFYEAIIMVKMMDNGMYDINPLDGPNIFMQGASFSDINNDGAVDYFGCHDDALSSPYENDGAGNLFYSENLINTATLDPAHNSGNYACTWVDYDNDGDSDMYVSKCRLGVSDPEDGRRLNRMFQNDGEGNYTDVAEEIGLLPKGQSWATEFGDIDNDGDMDAIMINHDIRTKLYENDGAGNFTDISLAAGIDLTPANFANGLQTYMFDFDNDTYLDIILTSYFTFPKVYRNNGDKTFTELNNAEVFGTDINLDNNNDIQSGAIGDLNNDGFLDFLVGFANGINIPNTGVPDRLYLNSGNTNNYIKIDLEGITSNLNGIGARIELNGPWGTLIRDVKSGQGYGIMNSLQTTIGIGDATEISSIIVKWPSGCVTVINDPAINMVTTVIESCAALVSSTEEICEGETIIINGEPIGTPGVYSETVTTNGMDTVFQTTLVVHPVYNIELTPLSACHGQVIIINGQEITESGQYTFPGESVNQCDSTSFVDVTIFDAINVGETIVDDWGTINGAGSISLDMTNVIQPYTIEWSTGEIDVEMIENLLPGEYSVTITDGNNCSEMFSHTVDLNTSLIELQEKGLEVYPIPTSQSLFIKDKNELAQSIELFSIVGQRVLSQNTSGISTEVNTGILTSGIYILKIIDADNQVIGTTKVIKD